ncbi:autotransporter-associated beta strand repeat-containing protein [Sphingomonas sp. Sphisp140]|uniref:autotransporter-associated beta strand repeat-containing protein n=1 Tax=unclassified Sphingomonas TaxID=196159 RepID=UPI0039AEB0D7
MIDRGNGARARGVVSMRVGREALLRKALLGSTALVGVAIASPAVAQTSANGGHVTSASGSTVTGNGANQGVKAVFSSAGGVTVDGATVSNTTGTPNANALDLENSGGTGFGISYANNASTLTTTQNGGAAAYISQTGANLGIGHTVSGNVFTGSYGERYVSSGAIFYERSGTGGSDTYIGNGTQVTGVDLTAANIGADFDSPTISGFATGISLASTGGASMTSLGGSITTLANGTGIKGSASSGGVSIDEASTITATTGIDAQAANNVTIAARGTMNSTAQSGGTGIYARGGGSVNITTTGIIGLGTYFATGIDAVGGTSGTNSITIGAHLRGDSGVATGAGAFVTTVQSGGEINAMSNSGYGVSDSGGGSIVNNGNIYSNGVGVALSGGGSLINNSSLTGAGGTAVSVSGTAAATLNLALGSITTGNVVVAGSGTATTTIAGTLTGNFTGSSGTGVQNVTLASTGQITGNVTLGSASDTFNWNGGTVGGTVNGGGGLNYFNAQLGAGNSASLAANATTNFYQRDLISGTLTLTGSSGSGGYGWQVENGTTLNFNTSAFNVAGGSYAVMSYGGAVNVLAGATVSGLNNFAATFGSNPVTFSNAGTISVDGNVFLSNGSRMDVTNTGTMTAASYGGVSFNGGGTLTNSGTITGGSFTSSNIGTAVSATGAAVTINNNAGGIIQSSTGGPYAVLLSNGSTLNNAAGATIRQVAGARQAGVFSTGAISVNNSGSISTAATGGYDAITANGRLTLVNDGTIIAATASGVAFTGASSSLNLNGGTVQGGSDVNWGYGVQAAGGSSGTLTVANGATSTGGRGGLLVAGSGLVVTNAGTIRGTDAASFGVRQSAGTVSIINTGSITGYTNAISATGGTFSLNNSGIVGTGSVSGGVLTPAGTGNAISIVTGTVTNGGTINGAAGGVVATGALTLTNSGTITSRGTGTGNFDGVTVLGAANILNAGTITGGVYAGIYSGGGGTITNAAAGHLVGASSPGMVLDAGGTFNNYGSSTNGASAGISGNGNSAVNLFAGSTTGSIALGSGNDTLSIYNGRGTSGAAIVDLPSGITLQNAGTLASASFGSVNLGGGTNALVLRGSGDGSAANGVAGSLALGNVRNAGTLSKADTGTWTLTGNANLSGITQINAGTGLAAGTLVFNNTSNLYADINVNGAIIRATSANAFGYGVIYATDPTIQFGATGSYSNDIILQSTNPANDPTRIQVDSGVTATLTGTISEDGGNAQPLVFDGLGTAILTNYGYYTGLTSINAGTVIESNTAGALGSGDVTIASGATLQFDNQTGGGLSIKSGTYTGAGTIRFTGNAGAVTILGNAGNVTFSLGSGGLVDVQGGIVAGSASGQGFWTGNLADLNVAAGATFDGVEGNIRVDALTGAGTVRNGYFGEGSLTLGVDNGGGVFTGLLADSTNANSPLILIKTGTGTQTLAGTNTYTGSTTISGGALALSGNASIATSSGVSVASGATFNISGLAGNTSVTSLTGSGSLVLGANTLTMTAARGNFGLGVSGTGGLAVSGVTAPVTFSGTLTNAGGLTLSADATISGSVSNSHAPGAVVLSADGVQLSIVAGGTVTSTATSGADVAAVYASAANATVNNAGTINSGGFEGGGNGSHGIYAAGALALTNSGNIFGVPAGSAATVRNNGVFAFDVSTVTNTGTITGGWDGLFLASGGTVSNSGTLLGNLYAGVEIGGDATITNNIGGSIRGVGGSSAGLLINGGDGVTVNNNAGGTIHGEGVAGIYNRGTGAMTITNRGTIEGIGTIGIRSESGGSLTVDNIGTITSGGTAISAVGQATITNSGTVTGGLSLGGSNDALIMNGGSIAGSVALGDGSDAIYWNGGTISGTLDGGTGNDGLYLNRGTATTLSLASVSGFEVQNLVTSSLTLTGTRSGQYGWGLGNATTLNIGATGQAAHWSTVLSAATFNGDGAKVNVAAGSDVTSNTWVITGTGANAQVRNEGTISVASIYAAVNLSGYGAQVTNLGTISTSNTTGNYSVVYLSGANSRVVNSGTITGATSGGLYNGAVYLSGTSGYVENQQNGVINGQRGIVLGGFNGTAINAGTINATVDNGITLGNGGSATNSGTINALGADGAWGVLVTGGNGTVTNSGTISAGSGVWLQGLGLTFTVNNSGTINGTEYGVNVDSGTGAVVNTNQIAANQLVGVRLAQGGSLTNSGTITGGSDATLGYGVAVEGGDASITNQSGGTINGGTAGAIWLAGTGTVALNLDTGSTVNGTIRATGSGTRNVDISGAVHGDYEASSGAGIDNVIFRSGGSISNVHLGDGDDSFTYFGGAIGGLVDGGAGNDKLFADFGAGTSYNVSLATFTGFESIGLVSGDLTLTGPSNDPGQAIYAGIGGAPAGTITFDGTSDLTGDIYVNGGSIRANTAGAFGTGTIHMIDPTATFGATGTYANNISLEVVTPSSANPSTLNADSNLIATLTGAITTSGAAGVDPNQDLVFGGQGTIVLTNTANNWTGATTINSGAALQGASDTISGSAILNNGTLAYQQAYSGTVSQNITGNGYVNVSGLAAGNVLTFAGTNSFNGTIQIADASNVAISGATSSGNVATIDMGSGASRLDVTATGSLTSNGYAVTGSGANQSVFNLGSITSNGSYAISMTGANVLVDNSGSITGIRAFSTNATDAQLINRAGGTLTGTTYQAVYMSNGGTIDNSGTIEAFTGYPAIYSASGATTITNNAGGMITGNGTVIAVYGAGSSLTNAGSITSTADTAVYLASGGTVTNSGSITANGSGIGLWTSAGGTFTNQAGGTITGGNAGMILDGADLITVNLEAGSTTDKIFSFGNGARVINIFGTLNGNYAGGAGDDAITLGTSATVNGAIDGGAGNNTLELTGTGAATLGAVSNIASTTKSDTGTWTLAGPTDIAAWTVTGGTLATNGGAIADTASVALNGGSLQLNGNEAIGILTGNGTGTADLGTSVLALTNGTGRFTGTLSGTTGSLLIDGANLSFGGAANYAGLTEVRSGSLALTPGATVNSASTLLVGSAGTLDLGTTSVGIGAARLDGTLNGTGTLTANTTALNGATVNGNLTGGLLTQVSGTSTLVGTANMNVLVGGGTLLAGGNDRIADTATLQLDSGATLDLQAFNDTVGTAVLNGTLAGTGTLTAGQYQLTGATVNANLGAGTVFNLGGNSTLNGTAGGNVAVNGGTLTLGAANRLADTATVAVASGATLDLRAYSDTIGTLALNGTLAGAGTLTAGQYQLTGATVDANLGAGTVFNLGGTSSLNGNAAGGLVVQAGALTLNGTAGGDVAVNGGTLALGASSRLADAANVSVASGATLDIGRFNDTVGMLGLAGTLAGTGTLTASQYQLAGATVNANLGAGTVFNLSGTSTLNGTAAGDVSVEGGTLALGAANRLADPATVAVASGATLNIGAFNDTVGLLGLNGTLAGTGTLTASQYQLTGAAVNANLGTGTVFNLGGTSMLNGTAAGDVSVQAGTLTLGAANRLADTATVSVATGSTLNLGANSDTVAALSLGGTLAGTGTLTAGQYQLTAATVNANLGAGTLANMGGTSVLSGTAAANTVTVQAGTLRLGASDRLADTAVLGVASGATFDLANYNETVASLAGTGTIALGTGRLTLASNASTGFGGAITGAGTIDKQGTGTLTLAGTFANTGRIDVSAGALAFSGSSQGGIRVQGGTLIGGGTLAGALTIDSGTFSPGGLATGALGAINPIGNWTVGSLVATGGNLLFDFGGTSFNFASDSIKVNGTATLSGGTVAVNALTSTASDYRFNQLYTIVQANSLTGTFANGSTFSTVSSNPNLKWRLRYDLVANAVVLQVQKNMEFNDGVSAGDINTLAVANALSNSTTGNASDAWAATLNTITALDTNQRVAAFKSFSGEALADISTATISANNLFTDLLRQRVGDGSDALVGGGFSNSSLADVRTTTTAGNNFASALAGATLPGTGSGDDTSRSGIWGQVYGGYQKLAENGPHAGVENTTAGVAMGIETKLDGFTLGIAGGVAQIDSDMNSRASTVSGNQYQLGGYASYDAGSLFVAASGSWYSGDFDSKRTLFLGGTTSLATGDVSSKGYSFGLTGGFRTELGNGLRLALIGTASKVNDKRDGFTESAAGGLGLQVASASRDLFTASGELRLGTTVKTGAGTAMPWISMGVRYNSGDLDTLGAMRFSGAPAGTGAFGVSGTRIAPVLGTLGLGIDARASKNVRLGIALEGAAGENTREGRASVRVKIGF